MDSGAHPAPEVGRNVAIDSYYIPLITSGEEVHVNHGIVDVFAYQEALLIEAAFGIALLTMIWVAFRRWLHHKDKMGRLLAEQSAERSANHGAQMERVEARLKAIEAIVTDGGMQTAKQIEAPANPAAGAS
jgi:hypothetical protein